MAAFGGAGGGDDCDRCGHVHGEDEKCKICQHMGRRIIFPGPADPAPPPAEFHYTAVNLAADPGVDGAAEALATWRLGVIARSKCFIEEKYPGAPEVPMTKGVQESSASGRKMEWRDQDAFDNNTSRHILGKVGDAPVSYARWRVATQAELGLPSYTDGGDPSKQFVAIIDRFCTLPSYRRRGFGFNTLHACLLDIANMAVAENVAFERVSMFVHYSAFGAPLASLLTEKFGFVAFGAPHAADPSGFFNPAFVGDSGVQEFVLTMDQLGAIVQAAQAATGGGGGM